MGMIHLFNGQTARLLDVYSKYKRHLKTFIIARLCTWNGFVRYEPLDIVNWTDNEYVIYTDLNTLLWRVIK